MRFNTTEDFRKISTFYYKIEHILKFNTAEGVMQTEFSTLLQNEHNLTFNTMEIVIQTEISTLLQN